MNYTFEIQFQNSTGNNYLRIPLATFAQDAVVAGGYKRCMLEMTYMTEYPNAQSYIILGGMFFHDFFAVFNNKYTTNSNNYLAVQ